MSNGLLVGMVIFLWEDYAAEGEEFQCAVITIADIPMVLHGARWSSQLDYDTSSNIVPFKEWSMYDNMTVSISSPPDRERLVADIFIGNEQWAELNQEQEDFQLEIYPRQNGQPWSFRFQDVVDALNKARARLSGDCA